MCLCVRRGEKTEKCILKYKLTQSHIASLGATFSNTILVRKMKKKYSEPCLPLALYRMPFRMSQYKLLVYRRWTTAVASTLRHHHGLYRCIFISTNSELTIWCELTYPLYHFIFDWIDCKLCECKEDIVSEKIEWSDLCSYFHLYWWSDEYIYSNDAPICCAFTLCTISHSMLRSFWHFHNFLSFYSFYFVSPNEFVVCWNIKNKSDIAAIIIAWSVCFDVFIVVIAAFFSSFLGCEVLEHASENVFYCAWTFRHWRYQNEYIQLVFSC